MTETVPGTVRPGATRRALVLRLTRPGGWGERLVRDSERLKEEEEEKKEGGEIM